MERTSAGRFRRRGAVSTSPAPEVASAPEFMEPVAEHEPVVPLATPEPVFAARVPPPAPAAPLPTNRRAIFFDVENTSSAGHIARVIEHLAVDRAGWRTEFVAIGNWRVIGQDTARLLARHGAQLVHSAPSTGVRDWSDLRIAVSAGVWLAAARPGDVLEIVSDDRAFDAVGDVAAGLGIAFPRLVTRLRRIKELSVSPTGMITLVGPTADGEPVAEAVGGAGEPAPPAGRRRRRGRRGGRRRRREGAADA